MLIAYFKLVFWNLIIDKLCMYFISIKAQFYDAFV